MINYSFSFNNSTLQVKGKENGWNGLDIKGRKKVVTFHVKKLNAEHFKESMNDALTGAFLVKADQCCRDFIEKINEEDLHILEEEDMDRITKAITDDLSKVDLELDTDRLLDKFNGIINVMTELEIKVMFDKMIIDELNDRFVFNTDYYTKLMDVTIKVRKVKNAKDYCKPVLKCEKCHLSSNVKTYFKCSHHMCLECMLDHKECVVCKCVEESEEYDKPIPDHLKNL